MLYDSILQNGNVLQAIHLGNGIMVPVEVHRVVRRNFLDDVWPRVYPPACKDSKNPEMKRHKKAMDSIRDAVWPSMTKYRFHNLPEMGSRSEFHQLRFEAAMNYLELLWKAVVDDRVENGDITDPG